MSDQRFALDELPTGNDPATWLGWTTLAQSKASHPGQSAWVSAGLFAAACITDWFDGYLARTLNQGSAFGRFLDPRVVKGLVESGELERERRPEACRGVA